ncbi:NupC/NupG family nucleoside CNT transporter [Psittacicella gerlachiana]|uniref:Nucleoside permease n=1 Tax=Psittacicella gerlachiana TaxID=2028574 RepID=A0A3A1YIN2_9GAMM|nr:NupC/NupG family nucleoside CNT transporter [Psittacicella gerlachiana]RIY37525.1 NupC/NupG family nucleoside CNT transporter [Psittacicella gerlachiana]
MSLIMSFVGIFVLLAIGFLFSKHKTRINYRTVLVALLIQFLFGGFVLYVPVGQQILFAVSEGFVKLLGYVSEGVNFLLGFWLTDVNNVGFVFAFKALPVIIYLASLISVLYYLGVMKIIIRGIGGALKFLLGTSETESLSAAANIFVGQTEAPLTVKPYIAKMTESELFAVMVGGLASVAGSVLAGYIGMGIPAPYLIAASFMSAPGGLLFAKLLIPETEKSVAFVKDGEVDKEDAPANVLEAAARGASDGMFLVLNVAAMLLAFLSIIALINGILSWFGGLFNFSELNLTWIVSIPFRYLAFLIGVPWQDSSLAGGMIGIKLITNEFVGYLELSKYVVKGADGTFAAWQGIQPITGTILSFALCGFANLSSIAILIGGLGVMAPSRRADVARLGLYAVLGGCLSNLMSATIAGFYFSLGGGV